MLGWNRRVLQIALELDGYVSKGSRLTLVTRGSRRPADAIADLQREPRPTRS